jgi:hypothetical protein
MCRLAIYVSGGPPFDVLACPGPPRVGAALKGGVWRDGALLWGNAFGVAVCLCGWKLAHGEEVWEGKMASSLLFTRMAGYVESWLVYPITTISSR